MVFGLFKSKEELKSEFLRWWEMGHLVNAIQVGKKLVKKDPQDFENLHDLGVVYLDGGVPDLALECLLKAKEIEESPVHWNSIGRAHQACGGFDDALSAYQKSCELAPSDAQPAYNISVCQRESGDMDAAYQTLLDTVAAFPEHAGSHNDLALHLEIKEKIEESVEQLDAALKADPEYDPARQNIVRILCDLDDLQRARPYLDFWKQQGRTVEVSTNKNTIEIKLNGFVMYERELS